MDEDKEDVKSLCEEDNNAIEERYSPYHIDRPEFICTCKEATCTCKHSETRTITSEEKVEISSRKLKLLTAVARTEDYLRKRRIPELIRFLVTKLLSETPDKPITYLENLLDSCMLFRAGHGQPPVLYEQRHLEAVVKSFDPGQRGWLTVGQVRRAFATLGLTPPDFPDEKISTDEVLTNLKTVQENELFSLLSAGTSDDSDEISDAIPLNSEDISKNTFSLVEKPGY